MSLTSHDAHGLTRRDVDLAAAITAIADELGIEGEPGRPQGLEIAIDALDIPAVVPFWRAVLGYVRRAAARRRTPRLPCSTRTASVRRCGSSRWTSPGRSATGSTST